MYKWIALAGLVAFQVIQPTQAVAAGALCSTASGWKPNSNGTYSCGKATCINQGYTTPVYAIYFGSSCNTSNCAVYSSTLPFSANTCAYIYTQSQSTAQSNSSSCSKATDWSLVTGHKNYYQCGQTNTRCGQGPKDSGPTTTINNFSNNNLFFADVGWKSSGAHCARVVQKFHQDFQ